MSVSIINRRESKKEYDSLLFKIQDDAVKLTDNSFGASKDIRKEKEAYIFSMKKVILENAHSISRHVRKAYSIFPKNDNQLDIRKTEQEQAIGLCFDLLTKYQDVFKKLHVSDEKYVGEMDNIIHEIKSIDKWKKSDANRFKF